MSRGDALQLLIDRFRPVEIDDALRGPLPPVASVSYDPLPQHVYALAGHPDTASAMAFLQQELDGEGEWRPLCIVELDTGRVSEVTLRPVLDEVSEDLEVWLRDRKIGSTY